MKFGIRQTFMPFIRSWWRERTTRSWISMRAAWLISERIHHQSPKAWRWKAKLWKHLIKPQVLHSLSTTPETPLFYKALDQIPYKEATKHKCNLKIIYVLAEMMLMKLRISKNEWPISIVDHLFLFNLNLVSELFYLRFLVKPNWEAWLIEMRIKKSDLPNTFPSAITKNSQLLTMRIKKKIAVETNLPGEEQKIALVQQEKIGIGITKFKNINTVEINDQKIRSWDKKQGKCFGLTWENGKEEEIFWGKPSPTCEKTQRRRRKRTRRGLVTSKSFEFFDFFFNWKQIIIIFFAVARM